MYPRIYNQSIIYRIVIIPTFLNIFWAIAISEYRIGKIYWTIVFSIVASIVSLLIGLLLAQI